VNKGTMDGERKLISLYLRSHFHILLSTAECFGVTYCEANACGVPNIAAEVGGVSAAVRNGRGGWLCDSSAPVTSIADKIANIFSNKDEWRSSCVRARQEYESRLNWEVSGKLVKKRLEALL
jgi:glycosyltransferase involved in cell wall biosynthesis